MTPQQFISAIAHSAVAFMRAHKISAALVIAQGALESGWGGSAPGNNLFGIKADASWTGHTITESTQEVINGKTITVQAKFRAYANIGDSLSDHAQVLLESRYKNLIGADYKTACGLIGALDHYATDPQYGAKLLEIIQQYDLIQYDEEATKMPTPKDTKGTQWETVATWAVENGVMFTYGDGTFKPDQPVSRGQVAASLYNLYKLLKG
jgi:flagellum-specific peptidoglycan hydrolase FlgJ